MTEETRTITGSDIHALRFAECVFNGMSQRQAYITTFDFQGTDGTADSCASEYLRKPKVQARLQELRAEQASKVSKNIANSVERMQALTEIIRAPLQFDLLNPSHRITAADVMNKMERLYAIEPAREVNTNNTLVFILPGGGKVPAPSLNALAVSSSDNPCPIDDALTNQGVVLPVEVVDDNETPKQGNP